MKFYLLAFTYLFVFFGAIYGFFVTELKIGLGAESGANLVLTGWVKNLTCSIGLLLVALVPTYPIVRAVYRALEAGNK